MVLWWCALCVCVALPRVLCGCCVVLRACVRVAPYVRISERTYVRFFFFFFKYVRTLAYAGAAEAATP
jgi:hypothetical protein